MKPSLRRSVLRVLAHQAILLALAGCAPMATQAPPAQPPTPSAAQAPRLRLIGTASLPPLGTYGGTTVGGISGIDYDSARGIYLLISDDRFAAPARIYTARLHYQAGALAPPELTGVATLLHGDGLPFDARPGVDRPDAEAVRWLPGGTQFLWTSEGDFPRGFGPQLRVARADGTAVRDIALPSDFRPVYGYGPRRNGTLEGLALTPDGRTAWLAMELPWRQDGLIANPRSPGAPVRFTAIAVDTGQALRQIAYQPDAVPQARRLPWGAQVNGVSEILADGPHHLLVLERAYSAGAGFAARLYRIDTREGSDTLALTALTPGNHHPAPKTLVADFAALGIAVDNLEGMTWGPPLPGGGTGSDALGGCVLVFVSDDNFNPAQVTQFIAAEYLEPPGGHGRCGTTGASP